MATEHNEAHATATVGTAQEPAQPPTQSQQQQQQQQQDQDPEQQLQQQEPMEEDGNGEGGDDVAAPESPPLPSKYTATTPGLRATRLQEVFATILKHTLDKISWANFSACYPTIATHAPGTLQAVQQQMVRLLGDKSKREFEAVLQNRNVVPKLNELESLISDAARRRDESGGDAQHAPAPIPLHLLPADDILAAHLAPHLASQQSQLNARLQTTQAHNSRLFDEIQAQRREIELLLGGVEKVLADMDGASQLLGAVADEVALESRSIEVDMTDI